MYLILRWLFLTLVILVIPRLVSGVHVDDFATALAAAAVLSILNVVVKPLLVLLTLPFTLISLGFFLLVINALVFWMVGSLVSGFHVDGFGPAFWSALLVSIASWISYLPGRVSITRLDRNPTVRDLN